MSEVAPNTVWLEIIETKAFHLLGCPPCLLPFECYRSVASLSIFFRFFSFLMLFWTWWLNASTILATALHSAFLFSLSLFYLNSLCNSQSVPFFIHPFTGGDWNCLRVSVFFSLQHSALKGGGSKIPSSTYLISSGFVFLVRGDLWCSFFRSWGVSCRKNFFGFTEKLLGL